MDIRNSSRTVVAGYLGLEEGDGGLTWMENAQKAQEPDLGILKNLKSLSKGMRTDSPSDNRQPDNDSGKSLIDDIQGGLSIPRETDAPMPNKPEESDDSGQPTIHFNAPDHYKTNESLKHWWDSRERQDEATGTAFGNQLTGGPVEASSNTLGLVKVAAKTLNQIIRGNHNHKRLVMIEKGNKLRPKLESTEEQKAKGLYMFKTTSDDPGRHGGKPAWTTVVQFLKSSDAGSPAGGKYLVNHNCLVGCDCPAFLYWGAQYYALQGKYMYMDLMRPTIVVPKSYIPGVTEEIARGKDGTFCKHVYAVYQMLMRVEDKPLTEGFESEIVHLSEPGYIQEGMRKLSIGSYEDFRDIIKDGDQLPEVVKEVDRVLESQSHGNIEEFHQWLDAKWDGEWRGNVDHKRKVLESVAQSPHLILYILTYESGHMGSIPEVLIKVGWNLVKRFLVNPVKEEPEEGDADTTSQNTDTKEV